ncbi:zinc finger MYM-type protein 6-like [Homalodisca vitripennis]|uniref:zinc finger MYM-type protein 6-like n=1 Tax=Homalodisca vitripennis TaxID=197043 RepID=UPI001EEAF5C7|nr:zinc finger MYM-type protein 6-like [Homalodisca vitripennis]
MDEESAHMQTLSTHKGETVEPFGFHDNELTLQNGCIFKGYRIMIPEALQHSVLNELHVGHLGMEKMNILARSFCAWKSIDRDIEQMEIEGGISGKELFDIVNNFMAENDINWEDCVGVCTDGGRSMSGHYQGLQSRIREKAPNTVWTHCIIHGEALAAAKFSSELSAQHSSLLYYSSARWLSLGNSLLRLFELKQEIIHIFLSEDNNALADTFIDESFLLKLAFLTDIFERLNILNKSLQGNNTDIFQLTSKVEAFKNLMLWEKSLKNGDCSMFSTLNQFLKENDLTLKEEMKTMLTQHLSRVQSYFEDYLPKDEIKAQQWVNDPFQTEMPENFSNEEAEQLIDISTDLSLKSKFQSQCLFEFWNGTENDFPLLSKKSFHVECKLTLVASSWQPDAVKKLDLYTEKYQKHEAVSSSYYIVYCHAFPSHGIPCSAVLARCPPPPTTGRTP